MYVKVNALFLFHFFFFKLGFCCLGVLLCVIGLFIAMIVSTLDKIGMRQLGQESVIQEESRKMVGRMTGELIES